LTASNFFIKEEKYQLFERLLLILLAIIFVGFVSSRAFISIGTGGLLVLGIYYAFARGWAMERGNLLLLIPVLFFIPYVFSYTYSENTAMCSMWLMMKLPFLILPFAFWMLPDISQTTLQRILFLFVAIAFVSTLVVLYNYIKNFQLINESFLSGGSMPVPFSHIRYSLILVFTFFSVIWLYMQQKRKSYLLLSVYLFLILHILSVRSGLIALYSGLILSLIYFIVKSRNWKLGFVILLGAGIGGWASFKFIPSLHNRLAYMNYDYGQWKNGKIDGNSDAMRLASLKVGVQMVKENFWIGVGTGDILQESKSISRQLFPQIELDESRKMPHNQFLWTLCSMGFVGLLFFMTAWLLPLVLLSSKLHFIATLFHCIMAVSFMVEYTLEEQVGGTFFMVFSMLFLKQMSKAA